MSDPKLYVIGTPLGNKSDITLRALEAFRSLEYFFAEDTRELQKLMELHGISPASKTIHSYGNHNMREATDKGVRLLQEGKSIGFVSDRGTPGISDPGPLLVARAREAGFHVVPVPGPSSVVTALSVAGVPGDRFVFLGFLPTAKGEREARYAEMRKIALPVVFFESPNRVRKTLEELRTAFPSGNVFIGREMTKLYETYSWHALRDLAVGEVVEKGEFVLVLDPGAPREVEKAEDWEEAVRLRLAPDKEWAKALAARCGRPASEIYNTLQKLKNSREPNH